jgi:hypothetical protein
MKPAPARSPEPPRVASQAASKLSVQAGDEPGRRRPPAARPSGAATTVSGPFSSTTAPARRAASRAAAVMRSGELGQQAGKDPLELAGMRGQHVVAVERREQRFGIVGEAGQGVGVDDQGRAGAGQGEDVRIVASPTPAAGPITTASACSARVCRSARFERRQHHRLQVGGVDGQGVGRRQHRHHPGPDTQAPRAASRAAPVFQASPLTTIIRPRACLWASSAGHGKRSAHRARDRSRTDAPAPSPPGRCRPPRPRRRRRAPRQHMGRLAAMEGDGQVRLQARSPSGRPVSPWMPLGTSTATIRAAPGMTRARRSASPSSGRDRPAPNRQSI